MWINPYQNRKPAPEIVVNPVKDLWTGLLTNSNLPTFKLTN